MLYAKAGLAPLPGLQLIPITGFTVATNNRYLDYSSGGNGTDNLAYITSYIDISAYKKLRYTNFATTANVKAGMCWYDASKTRIGGQQGFPKQAERGYIYTTVTVPEGAVYAKFTVYKDAETYGDMVIEGACPLVYKVEDCANAIPEIEDTSYVLAEMPPVIKTNYDNNGNAHLSAIEGRFGIYQLDIKRQGDRLTVDGHFVPTDDEAQDVGYIGLNGTLRRTETPATVKTWESNLTLKSGHSYIVSLRHVSGTITKGTGAYVALSVYKEGANSSVGTNRAMPNGATRYFVADGSNYNIVFFLYGELTFENAVFEITLEDRWDYGFSPVANTGFLYKGTDARGVQGGVLHDCVIYSYCYAGWHGLRKVDLRTGVQTERETNLGHGNDMTWYNGKLYLVSMEETGRIYIIDPDTLTTESYVDFQMDAESPLTNSGIAYDSKNDRFIIKTNNGFAFADTSLNFQSFVSREYLSVATGQGIETDGYYIYVMESLSGASGGRIDVYNFDGSWVDTVIITRSGEPETLCYENGAWWYFNNIESPTSWEVCGIIINRQVNMPALASYAKYFGKV